MYTARFRWSRFLFPLVLAGSVWSTGCAAVRAGIQVQDAQAARDSAIQDGADTLAVYEFTMAERYLEKAWEEMGTGAYKTSVELSRKSAEWSDQAVVQMRRGDRGVAVDLDGLQDSSEAAPEPALDDPEPTQADPAPAEANPEAPQGPEGETEPNEDEPPPVESDPEPDPQATDPPPDPPPADPAPRVEIVPMAEPEAAELTP